MRKSFRLLLVVGILAALFITRPLAQQPGRILYVNNQDATCNGRLPCFTTIQAAVNAAFQGDIIRIQAGTYAEKVTISGKNNTANSTESDRLIIEADPNAAPGGVVLRPPSASCLNGQAVVISQSKFVTLRGLTITGAVSTGVMLLGGPQQNQAIHIERSRIVANSSPSCPGGGIAVVLDNPDTLIVNTLIHGNGGNGITFVDTSGGPHWLIQNTIHGNGWNGVGLVLGHTVTLANNLITGNGQASGTLGGRQGVVRAGLPGQSSQSVLLLNNLICGNRLGELSGPLLDGTDSGNFTPQGSEGSGVSASPGCQIPGNVYADFNGPDALPNTADDDFRLAANAPAIDRGMAPHTLGLDVLFNPIFEADYLMDLTRPRIGIRSGSAQFDIGAHEYIIPNQAPVANAGQPITVTSGTVFNLNGTGSFDPDGDAIAYLWSQTAGPSVNLSNPTAVTPTLTAPTVADATLLVFQLTVSDGLATGTASVTVTVLKPNRPPVLDPIGSKTVNVGNTLTFTINATDPDNDPLIYSVSPLPLPANASFNTNTRIFTFTPTASQAGSYSLTFSVSDGRGGTASETITITVTAGLAINITSPANGATVPAGQLIVQGAVTNFSGGEVGVTVNGFAAGVQGNTFTALVVVTPETTTLTATAMSPSGATANQTVNIAVSGSAVSAGDLFASPTSGVAPLTVKFSLRANATQVTLDADSDGFSEFTGASLDQLPYTYTQPGVYIATATAMDADGVQRSSNAVIQVLDRSQLDALLQSRWSSMRDALIARDIPRALNQLLTVERERYGALFTQLGDLVSTLGIDMPTIQAIYLDAAHAKYRLRRQQMVGGVATLITYYVYFSVDADGIWRIDSF